MRHGKVRMPEQCNNIAGITNQPRDTLGTAKTTEEKEKKSWKCNHTNSRTSNNNINDDDDVDDIKKKERRCTRRRNIAIEIRNAIGPLKISHNNNIIHSSTVLYTEHTTTPKYT